MCPLSCVLPLIALMLRVCRFHGLVIGIFIWIAREKCERMYVTTAVNLRYCIWLSV